MSPPGFLVDLQSLAAVVPVATFERALTVYRNQQVLGFHVGGDSHSWEINGDVLGSGREIYDVSVSLDTTAQGQITFFSGECSCPVTSNCKHSVALVLKASYKSAAVRVAAPRDDPYWQAQKEQAERQRRERERQLADERVRHWLDALGKAQGQALPDDDAERLVYMLVPAQSGGHPVLQLGAGVTRRLRNGNWAKVQQPQYLRTDLFQGEDAEIVRMLENLTAHSNTYSRIGYHGVVAGQLGLLAMQMAAATGRLYSISGERVLHRPLAWGPPRPLAWQWQAAAPQSPSDEPSWVLQPQLPDAAAQVRWFGNSPPLYLDTEAGLCGPLETPGLSTQELGLLMKAPAMSSSALTRHQGDVLRHLAGLPPPPGIHAPDVLQGLAPVARLRIEPVAAGETAQLGLLRATLRFGYGELSLSTSTDTNPLLVEPPAGRRVLLHRDLAAEHSARAALAALGLQDDGSGRFHLRAREQQPLWLQWFDGDFARLREAGFDVAVDAALAGWIERADALEVRLEGLADAQEGDLAGVDDSRSPWFDLSLGLEIGGRRQNILPLLPQLLARLQQQAGSVLQLPAHVYLPQADGRFLRLPTEPLRPWLQALLELVGERGQRLEGDSLRLSRLEALRVGAVLGEDAQWQGAQSLRRMVQQLAGHGALPHVAVPAGLQAKLRPYQQRGLEWLQFLRTHGLAGILADDMGLGKTVQTLAHVLVEKHAGRLDRPVLVIAPVSLLGNWRREALRFAPELSVLVLHGQQRHEAAESMAGHDLVIAPYSLLQRDRERWLRQRWHLVVLDEAQNIKNANTYAAQIVGELDTRHRLCLSGTPMENHLGELWGLFNFLMPGFLGSQVRFKELFRTPIEKLGDSQRMELLRRRVTPFILRRVKSEVATDLPEKQETVTGVELGDKQADLYETIRLATEKQVRQALSERGLAKSQIHILDALLKLRQVCCDPRLVPLAAARKVKQSAKLELLLELLPEMLAEGRRVLLFSQFTSMLELIERELAARDIAWVKLTGQSQRRDELIDRFTSGAVPLFLISLKAGGVGLNLTQADTVIHYDPWWNPAVENQATDRAHRIGQSQRVLVYKLVAQGTIEERIIALQERKAALADSLYGSAVARKQPLFTEDDLAELLKPLG